MDPFDSDIRPVDFDEVWDTSDTDPSSNYTNTYCSTQPEKTSFPANDLSVASASLRGTPPSEYLPKAGKQNRQDEISLAASIRRFLEDDFEQQDAAQREKEQEKERRKEKRGTSSDRHPHRHHHHHQQQSSTKKSNQQSSSDQPQENHADIQLMERREVVVALLERLLDIEDETEESQQLQQPQIPKTKLEEIQQERFGADALADIDRCFVKWLKKARMYREMQRKEENRPLPALPPSEFLAPTAPSASSAPLKASVYRPVLSHSVIQPINDVFATVSPSISLPALRIAPEVNYSKLALSLYQRCLSAVDSLYLFTPVELVKIKVMLYYEIAKWLLSINKAEESLGVVIALLGLDNNSTRGQKLLLICLEKLLEQTSIIADLPLAVRLISGIVQIPPIDECEKYLFGLITYLGAYLRETNREAETRINIVRWLRRQVAYVTTHPPTAKKAQVAPTEDPTSPYLHEIMEYQQKDKSADVQQAAKEAIEAVGDFTLEVVQEGAEDEASSIKLQVFADKLKERSEYFRMMLDLDMAEKRDKRIRIVTPSPAVFLQMIEYLYTLDVNLTSLDQAAELLLCANQYGVEDLKVNVSLYLQTQVAAYHSITTQSDSQELIPLETWAQLHDIATLMELEQLRDVILSKARDTFFFKPEYREQFTADVDKYKEVRKVFPELINNSCPEVIAKLRQAFQYDNYYLADFCVDMLIDAKYPIETIVLSEDNPSWQTSTPTAPTFSPASSGKCPECLVYHGHLTSCSSFSRGRAPVPFSRQPLAPPLLVLPPGVGPQIRRKPGSSNLLETCLEKADYWAKELGRKLLSTGLFVIDKNILFLALASGELNMTYELLEVCVNPSEDSADAKEKGKEKAPSDNGKSDEKPSFTEHLKSFKLKTDLNPKDSLWEHYYQGKTFLLQLVLSKAPVDYIKRCMRLTDSVGVVDVNKVGLGDTLCHTPLTAAVETIAEEEARNAMVDFLVKERKADVNRSAGGSKPWSPLLFAVERQDQALVKKLIAMGADVNYSHGDIGSIGQVSRNFGDEITAVFESNAATALFIACGLPVCDKVTEGIASDLLAAGARANHDQYRKGRSNTPLMAACYRGHYPLIKLLLEADGDVNQGNYKYWTALHMTAQHGNVKNLRLMIANGAKDSKAAGLSEKDPIAIKSAKELTEESGDEEGIKVMQMLQLSDGGRTLAGFRKPSTVGVPPQPPPPLIVPPPVVPPGQLFDTHNISGVPFTPRKKGFFSRLRGL